MLVLGIVNLFKYWFMKLYCHVAIFRNAKSHSTGLSLILVHLWHGKSLSYAFPTEKRNSRNPIQGITSITVILESITTLLTLMNHGAKC